MGEEKVDMKFMISEVNKLLGKNYNLISFNALSPDDLLQILSDVLMEVQGVGTRIHIRTEMPEQSSIRIFSILRILKYHPSKDPAAFRQGLVQGEAETIHPILYWLLSNMELVKQRAYLAKFLVKIEIPVEYLGDPQISTLNEQYLNLVEQFKIVHREMVAGKKTGETAAELKADLQAMEKEKEVVTARIEKMKLRAEPALHLLGVAQALRMERDKEKDFALQKEQEREALSLIQVSLQRADRELQILKKHGEGITPQILLQRLSEEVTVLSAVAKEKLPSEINQKKNRVKALNNVAYSSYLGPDEIVALRSRLDTVTREIHTLVEAKISRNEMDKMEPFRQQTAAIANMKRNVLEKLQKIETELEELETRLEEKREQSKMLIEEVAPKEEEYKKYVSRLKVKNAAYRRNKAELDALKAENGVLRRTSIILEGKINKSTKSEKSFKFNEENVPHNFTLANGYSENVQLSKTISNLRSKLVPLLAELKTLRQKSSKVDERYEEAKKSHGTIEANIENSTVNLVSEINKLKQKIQESTTETAKLQEEVTKMKLAEERIQQEIKFYTSPSGGPTMRDELNEALTSEEKKIKTLKTEEENVKKQTIWKEKQMQQWQNIVSLFTTKLKCADENKQSDGIVVRGGGAETLILQ